MKRCKGPHPGCASYISILSSSEDHRAWQLVNGNYPEWWKWSMDDVVRARAQCAHTCAWSTWAHQKPKACCARTHPAALARCIVQTMWNNWADKVVVRANRAASSTVGENPETLTWLSSIFYRTPLLLWPLHLTLIVMLPSSDGWPERNVQFSSPAPQKPPRGKFLWCTPSADASGPFRQIFEF